MYNILIAILKNTYRDKEAMFWLILFPLIFVFVFRLFSFGDSVDANIIVIDKANNEISNELINNLKNVDGVGFSNEFLDSNEAKNALSKSKQIEFTYFDKEENKSTKEKGRANVVMIIPEDYADFSKLQENPDYNFKIDLIFSETDEGVGSPSSIIESIINQITTQMTLQNSNTRNPFTVERQGLTVNEIKYFDVLVPGIIGMGLMQSGTIGIAASIATLKEKKILKRLFATPISSWQFVLAQVTAFLLIGLVQTTIIIVSAKYILGANIYGSIPLIYMVVVLSSLIFLNLGFATAAVSKTASAAQSLANVLIMPMMFLSGVFFSRDGLPDGIRRFTDFLPLSPVIDALRGIALQEQDFSDIQNKLLIILIWVLVSFILAARLFRINKDS